MNPTITKVRCPNCFDEKPALGYCHWCGDTKWVPKDTALRFADVTFCFAGGGYIAGDNSFEEMRTQEARARAIANICGEPDRFSA